MSCCNYRKSLLETFSVSFPLHNPKILYTRVFFLLRWLAKESQICFSYFIEFSSSSFFLSHQFNMIIYTTCNLHLCYNIISLHNMCASSNLLDRLYVVVYKWHLHKLMRAPLYLLCPMQRLILNSLYQVRLILAHHVLLCLTIYYHYYLIGDFHWLLRFLQCGIKCSHHQQQQRHISNGSISVSGRKGEKTRRECKSLHCNIKPQ